MHIAKQNEDYDMFTLRLVDCGKTAYSEVESIHYALIPSSQFPKIK